MPPGPGNPLGTRWMGLSAPGSRHPRHARRRRRSATPPRTAASAWHIPDAEWLFNHVKVGTPVFIVSADGGRPAPGRARCWRSASCSRCLPCSSGARPGPEGGAAAALRRGEDPVAPAFDLERLDRRRRLELASLRGKAVVINFWASWCLPVQGGGARCSRRRGRSWRSKGVVFVGVDAHDFVGRAHASRAGTASRIPIVHDGPGARSTTTGSPGFRRPSSSTARAARRPWSQGELSKDELEAGIREALAS